MGGIVATMQKFVREFFETFKAQVGTAHHEQRRHQPGRHDADDERKVLQDYLALVEQEAIISGMIKSAQEVLITKVDSKYGQLSVDEVKILVVEDKWITNLTLAVQSELDSISQVLTERIRELVERYESPLPQIADEVMMLSKRVDEHLKKMGVTWR